MKDLSGKFAVVTGAAQGIGKAIAKRFVEENVAGLAILDYNIEKAAATAKELDGTGSKVISVFCDIGSPQAITDAFKKVLDTFGQIDILINNAGLTRDAIMHKMTLEQWNTVINANLTGTYLCMKEVIPGMRERQYGKIVNVSSVSAYGNAGQVNYSASKAGIMGITTTAAIELGRKNITVNAIVPGSIDTPMVAAVPQEITDQYVAANVPLQRMGKPEEVASAALFLASDDSSYITGEMLFCCGGGKMAF